MMSEIKLFITQVVNPITYPVRSKARPTVAPSRLCGWRSNAPKQARRPVQNLGHPMNAKAYNSAHHSTNQAHDAVRQGSHIDLAGRHRDS
jgi:hypothetical protein